MWLLNHNLCGRDTYMTGRHSRTMREPSPVENSAESGTPDNGHYHWLAGLDPTPSPELAILPPRRLSEHGSSNPNEGAYSSLTPVSLITLRHLSCSLCICCPYCSGLPATGSEASPASNAIRTGRCNANAILCCRRSITDRGDMTLEHHDGRFGRIVAKRTAAL